MNNRGPRASVPGWVITRPFLSTWAEHRAQSVSCRRLAINQPFAVGGGGVFGTGRGGGSLRKPPGAVPYDEAPPH